MSEELWYKDEYFWRKASPQWEIKKYGYAPDSKGDLIFNTLSRIIDQEDISEWADRAIWACSVLLEERKRWPDRMNQPNDAWNRVDKFFHPKKYRSQGSMTRDPFIPFFTIIATRWEWISFIEIPWYLYDPCVFAWRRYILFEKKGDLRIYNFWRWLGNLLPKKDYVKRLDFYLQMAVNYVKD